MKILLCYHQQTFRVANISFLRIFWFWSNFKTILLSRSSYLTILKFNFPWPWGPGDHHSIKNPSGFKSWCSAQCEDQHSQHSRFKISGCREKKLKTKGTFRVGVLIKPTQIDARHRANYRLYRLNAGGLVNFFFNFLLKNFFEKYLWKYFWKMSLKNVFEKCLWIWIK